MIPVLRPYQQDAFNECREWLRKYLRVLLCSPTGSGKTVTFAAIARSAVDSGRTVMIVCHRTELIGQTTAKLRDYGLNPTIIAPGHKQLVNSCYVASIDTLVRRQAPELDLLIIDECHIQRFDKIIQPGGIYCNVRCIGVTATPVRPYKHSLHHLYSKMISTVQVQDLIDIKFLVPARTISLEIDTSNIIEKFNAETGEYDYDTTEVFKRFNKPEVYAGTIDQYMQYAKGTKALCFCVNVEHSKKMAAEFNAAGISAMHIDGSTPKHMRKMIMADHQKGIFDVLCNCGIATTGYDDPTVLTIIVARATMSLALWLQICGRGARPYINKLDFTIIDMGGNIYRHGFWEENRKWTLEAKKNRRTSDKLQVASIKKCPKCQSMLYASATRCKYCEHEMPRIIEEVITDEKFGVIKPSMLIKSKLEFHNMTDDAIRSHGRKMGYKPAWAEIKINLKNGKSINNYDVYDTGFND